MSPLKLFDKPFRQHPSTSNANCQVAAKRKAPEAPPPAQEPRADDPANVRKLVMALNSKGATPGGGATGASLEGFDGFNERPNANVSGSVGRYQGAFPASTFANVRLGFNPP